MIKQNFRYVLDMPIRMKPDQRPKYRMVHVSDHEDGCFLMAQNMQKRKRNIIYKNTGYSWKKQITIKCKKHYS